MSGLLLAIDPYIARLGANGANLGYFDPANTIKLDITQPDPDLITRVSKMRSTYGQALDSYSMPKPTEIEISIDECAPDILSMGLLGTPATYTQAAGTDQSLTFTARHDKWVALGKNNLSEFEITGKTENTDYVVNLEAGLVKVLSTGTIADATETTATASWAARSGSEIVFGTVPTLQLSIKGPGLNLFTQEQIEIEIYQANVSPSGALAFVTNEPVSMTFKGVLVTPTGKTGPYVYRTHNAA